ncbi:site-specific DNA-methyltransferase [bacterium]|nr:site-specific DNA-methyltransferase [bacterium]
MKKYENKIFNQDNREIFLDLPDNSVDLILTDPPYKDYQSNRPIVHSKVKKINQIDFDLPFFIRQSARVLKVGGHFYCWCDHLTFPAIYNEIIELEKHESKIKLEGRKRFSSNYLHYKNCLIWVKSNHGSGDLKGNFAPQHELILFACKGSKGRPLRGKRPSNVLFKRENGIINFYPKVSNNKFKHGTSKPVEILTKLIKISSEQGDLVFDPYGGSMSTGEACIRTNRKYLIVEIDEEFCAQGLERLENIGILFE